MDRRRHPREASSFFLAEEYVAWSFLVETIGLRQVDEMMRRRLKCIQVYWSLLPHTQTYVIATEGCTSTDGCTLFFRLTMQNGDGNLRR